MKSTTRDSFERMRIEAELRRLAEMETLVGDLQARLETVDQQIGDQDRLRKAIAPILSGALEDAGVDSPDAVAEAIAPYVTGTIRAEIAGTLSDEHRLRGAIAPVLSGALRDAGAADHGAVASSLAPYVVDTMRVEILNSQDELIEAIHPKLGVLIRAAIANAIEELNRKVDEALPLDRWIAAVKGRITGVSSSAFLLGQGRAFQIREALFIERQSGLLLARQSLAEADADEAQPDEDMLAGMIAAIQGFADDTFGSSGAGDLRRFSFTEDTVYLRATPTKLLAVRCSGVAPPEIETRIDMLLERALEQTRKQGGYEGVQLLENLQTEQGQPKSGVSASKIMAGGLGTVAAALVLVWGHGAVVGANQQRWLAEVDEVVHSQPGLGPYPLSVSLSQDGETIRVAGLLPDEEARERMAESIEWVATPLKLDIDVDVVRVEAVQ